MYLLVNGDRPNDHLFRLFSFHVVQPQGVNLGSQVASHLKKATATILFSLQGNCVHLIGPDGPLNCKMCINDLSTGSSTPHTRQSTTKGSQSNLIWVCCVAQRWRSLVGSSPRDKYKSQIWKFASTVYLK